MRWVPCSERLPESGGQYLVCEKRWGGLVIDKRTFRNGRWSPDTANVTHWMPLPKPPGKEVGG